jgi:hypothetical protein
MRLSAVTAVTATVLAFTFSQTTQIVAQDSDIGAASRPFPLDGGPSPASDNQERSSGRQSETTERSGDSSVKSQTVSGETRDTVSRGRAHTKTRLSLRRRHHALSHRRGHRFAFNHHRRHLVIHRRGHRLVESNDSGSA